MRRTLTCVGIVAALALTAAGCGSSAPSSTSVVARAARDTARIPGYRMVGTMTIASPSTGRIAMGLAGTYDRVNRRARLVTVELLGNTRVAISELISQLAVYIDADSLPGGARLTGGKRWLKLDLSHASAAAGAGSLPTASDPTQFVDYLRTVTAAKGGKTIVPINGVPTAPYTATLDLDRYAQLVPAAQRTKVTRSIQMLEAALGSHTLPVDVWIDDHGLVRRLDVDLSECVSKSRFQFVMRLNLYDFGTQPSPTIPSSRQVYNLTPLLSKELRHAKVGCSR